MSSPKIGCYGFHDLTSIPNLNSIGKMMDNFIIRMENIQIDATCDKSSEYVAYNFSINAQDIRFLQKFNSFGHSCNNVGGSPEIQFNMGDSAIHNETLCFIGLPCYVNFGNFSMPQCSDANSFKIEIRDSVQDLDQFTGNFQHSFKNITFTYSLRDNIKGDSRKIFIGDHYLTVIGSLQFPNKFIYTTSQVIVKITVAYCFNHLHFTNSPILVDMKYKLGEGPITQSFRPHSFEPNSCRYQYVLQSRDDQIIPKCISLNQVKQTISLNCSENGFLGKFYQLRVKAQFSDQNQSLAANPVMDFNVQIISDSFKEVQASTIMQYSPFTDQIMIEGQVLTLNLPEIIVMDSNIRIQVNLG
ncbi:UNKNOWN [Stylonychia lemnae]|uniref:Uncharacterized protein n=1 Tax=Stylonychia lemnae TaxID=5949 RepID=A0A078A126_STYLE|nr:UNKNOWN [Stylonychia lemnae]|eukprot:CDW75926.1 UNKNOWN [Stylonychia lemnae]